jgi:hypothetical protein
MYNDVDNLKDRYLKKELNTKTKKFKEYIFNKIEPVERYDIKKDFGQMNDKEVTEVLKSFRTGSLSFLGTVTSILRNYTQFCVDNGYNTFNWLDGYSRDILKTFISTNIVKNKFITIEQLREYQDMLVNDQDKVILDLLFMGLLGAELNEVRLLTIQDIIRIKDNEITKDELVGNPFIRFENKLILIPEKSYSIIKDAYEEEDYEYGNGITESKTASRRLNKSQYIIQGIGDTTGVHGEMKLQSLRTRFVRIKQQFIENQYITPDTIWKSGMFWRLDLIKEKECRELIKDDYVTICKLYKYNTDLYYNLRSWYIDFKKDH